MIGAAAALLLLCNGRIAGASHIVSGLLEGPRGDAAWRVYFVAGTILGAFVFSSLTGTVHTDRPDFPAGLLTAGGLLVGFGASLGSGCTSGHGVCGLGRLSPRSAVATAIFLATAIATTFTVRHVFGVA